MSADVFANNRLSLTLLESNLSSALFNLFSDEYDKTIHDFPDVLMDPDYGGSYDTTKTVYTYGIEDKGFKGGHFDWLKLHVGVMCIRITHKVVVLILASCIARKGTGASILSYQWPCCVLNSI